MNARLPEDWVSAYYDGELTPSERVEAERQLQASPAPRAELESYRRLSVMLNALPADAAPSELRHAVMLQAERSSLIPEAKTVRPAATASGREAGTRSARRRQSAGVLVAACMLVAATLLVWNKGPRHNGPRPVNVSHGLATRTETAPEASSLATADRPSAKNAVTNETPAGRYMGIVSNKAAFSGDGITNGAIEQRNALVPEADVAGGMVRGQSLSQAVKRQMLQNPQILGQMFYYFPSDDDRVAVVEMTVIDVRKSAGQLQVLLSRHAVEQTPATSSAHDEESEPSPTTDDARGLDELDGVAPSAGAESNGSTEELVAVFVQATPEQLAATVRELNLDSGVVDFSLHPPLQANVDQLASGDSQVWQQLDDSLSRQAPEDSALADVTADEGDERSRAGEAANDRDRSETGEAKLKASRRLKKSRAADVKRLAARNTNGRPDAPAASLPSQEPSHIDGETAIALKPGETRESLNFDTADLARGIRARSSYQMILPVPEARNPGQRGQKAGSNRSIARSDSSSGQQTQSLALKMKSSDDDAIEAQKPLFALEEAVVVEAQRKASTEPMNVEGTVTTPDLGEVKVLFIFTRPRIAIEPSSADESNNAENRE
ncbi:MAG: hypothetical protein WEB58_11645 [Planctomycetaceae bacterium]